MSEGEGAGTAKLESIKQQLPEHAPEGFTDGIERPEILLHQGEGVGTAELESED